MARGKHAVKAANRMAQLDSEIVAELKAKIKDLEAERDTALLNVQAAERNLHSRAQMIARGMSDDAVSSMRTKLEDGERAAIEVMQSAAEDIFDLFGEVKLFPNGEYQDKFAKILDRMKVSNFNELFDDACKRHGIDVGWGRGQRRIRNQDRGMLAEYHKQHRTKSDPTLEMKRKYAESLGAGGE